MDTSHLVQTFFALSPVFLTFEGCLYWRSDKVEYRRLALDTLMFRYDIDPKRPSPTLAVFIGIDPRGKKSRLMITSCSPQQPEATPVFDIVGIVPERVQDMQFWLNHVEAQRGAA